jgi:hypothetical protein
MSLSLAILGPRRRFLDSEGIMVGVRGSKTRDFVWGIINDLIFDLNAFVDDLRYRLWFFTSLSTVTITGPHLGTLHALHPIRER